jgi:hypothetical protein
VVVRYFNTPPSPIDRSSRQKINKESLDINDTIYQMDLIEVYRYFLLTEQYTFFLASHRTFSKIDHILGHKEILNKYKKIEITSYILSNYNAIKTITKATPENIQTIGG